MKSIMTELILPYKNIEAERLFSNENSTLLFALTITLLIFTTSLRLTSYMVSVLMSTDVLHGSMIFVSACKTYQFIFSYMFWFSR